MDVSTGGLSSNRYSGGGAGYYAGASTGSSQKDELGAASTTKRATYGGDSLTGLALARKTALVLPKNQALQQQIKGASMVRLVCGVLGAFGLFAFLTLALQPILGLLFTLGAFIANEPNEWLDFSSQVLFISLYPLVVGVIAMVGAYISHRRVRALNEEAAKVKAPVVAMNRPFPPGLPVGLR